MKKILVPTDFSKEANEAIQFAGFIAKSFQCRLVLIHVAEEPASRPGTLMANFEHLINHTKSKTIKKLKDIKQALLMNGIGKVQCVVKEGNLIIELSSYIEKEKIDLLVMGTKAYHNLVEVMAGSNTYDIVEEQLCPVLVVPDTGMQAAITDIIVATDCKPIGNAGTFSSLVQLVEQFKAKIEIVHVDTGHSINRKKELQAVSDLKKQLLPLKPPAFYIVQGYDIAQTLHAYMVESNANLLVLISRKKGFFKTLLHHSIVKEMVHRPKMPILILPDVPSTAPVQKRKSTKVFDLT